MTTFQRLYRGETSIDFMAMRKRFFTISGAIVVIAILSLAIFGLQLGIDFTGGTVIDAENPAGLTVAEYRSDLGTIGLDGARVQLTNEGERVQITTVSLSVDEQDELVSLVANSAGVTVDETNIDAVGPTFGSEITRRAIEALVIFLLVVAAFISWRFEWKMAGAALVALFHDLLLTAGIYSLFQIEVTPSTVIAVLTILGYSLYDTVVVFDKVGENVQELGAKHTYTEIANLSMNQVLMRSINTSLTSLLPVGSILFVGSFLLGATTLREFALALFIGIAAGTYSSIFVATPLLATWKETEPEWQRMQRRAARRSEDPASGETAAVAVAEVAPETVDAGAVPRPPRQRRKRR